MTYIDLGTKFNNSGIALEYLLADGLHPNEEGYKIWEAVITPKIKADMKRRGYVPKAENNKVTENSTNKKPNTSVIITGTEIYTNEISGELNQSAIR